MQTEQQLKQQHLCTDCVTRISDDMKQTKPLQIICFINPGKS